MCERRGQRNSALLAIRDFVWVLISELEDAQLFEQPIGVGDCLGIGNLQPLGSEFGG